MKPSNEHKRRINNIINALSPEVRTLVSNIAGQHCIRTPYFREFISESSDPTKLEALYRQRKAVVDKCRAKVRINPMGYLLSCYEAYMLEAFLEIKNEVSDAQYWRCLGFIWTSSEFVHKNKEFWLRLFRSKRRYRGLMMERNDRKYFKTLPDTLTIYRGYENPRYKMGLSWTLSNEKAAYFATRFSSCDNPRVASGVCKKLDVICYTNDRNEQEIIIDPKKVSGIKGIPVVEPTEENW